MNTETMLFLMTKQSNLTALRLIGKALKPTIITGSNARTSPVLSSWFKDGVAGFIPSSTTSPLLNDMTNLSRQNGVIIKAKGDLLNKALEVLKIPRDSIAKGTPRQREYFNRIHLAHEGEFENRAYDELKGVEKTPWFYGHKSPTVILRESNLINSGGDDALLYKSVMGDLRNAQAQAIKNVLPNWKYGDKVDKSTRRLIEEHWLKDNGLPFRPSVDTANWMFKTVNKYLRKANAERKLAISDPTISESKIKSITDTVNVFKNQRDEAFSDVTKAKQRGIPGYRNWYDKFVEGKQ